MNAKERSVLAIELRFLGLKAFLLFLRKRIAIVIAFVVSALLFVGSLGATCARAEVAEELKLLALVELLSPPLGDFLIVRLRVAALSHFRG